MAKAEHTEERCEDASHSESTSCKIHGKRLEDFREALGVRTRSRVAFNRHAALNSKCKLTVPPPALRNGVGRFAKKSKSFRFSAFQFFKYHPNVFEN
jgi:hypothetical protein